LREVISANEHLWGAIVYENERWHEVPLRKINVLDRIGGGDGFVGGLLYSILKGMESENGFSLPGRVALWPLHSLPIMPNLLMKRRSGTSGKGMPV